MSQTGFAVPSKQVLLTTCVAPVNSAGPVSEVQQWAAAAMSRPLRDEDAFAVRSWAKTGPVAACSRPGYGHNDPCSSSSC